jgi:carbonic anhydrase
MAADDNPILKPIIDELVYLKMSGSKSTINDLTIRSFIPSSLTNYYYYEGSLTTPFCDEVVQWVLIDKTLKISEEQLLSLQELRSDSGNEVRIKANILFFVIIFFN